MIKVYFQLAFRHLAKHRSYAIINILGLSASLTIFLVLWSYFSYETNYNSTFEKADRIYQLNTTIYSQGMDNFTAYDVGPQLQELIPVVKNVVRVHWSEASLTLNAGGDKKKKDGLTVQIVDPVFFDLFAAGSKFAALRGTLDNPYSMVVTRELASTFFRNPEDAIGQTISMKGEWLTADVTITGIVNDWPKNSTLSFDALTNIEPLLQTPFYRSDPHWNNFATFVELEENASLSRFYEAVPRFINTYMSGQFQKYQPELFLQPLGDIHLSDRDPRKGRDMQSLHILLIISFLILIIAWINYVNLSTARAMERAREVGVRKAVGVTKQQLIVQFLTESFLMNFIAISLAMLTTYLTLPVAIELIGREFELRPADPGNLIGLVIVLVLGTMASGIYPAIVLSSFRTTEVIKGNLQSGSVGFSLRSILIVFQFTASLCLLICTVAVIQQVNFMQRQDKGISTDQVLVVAGLDEVTENSGPRVQSFKNELSNLSSVVKVSTSGVIPGGSYNWDSHMEIAGKSKEESIPGENAYVIFGDLDIVPTYKMTVIEGRTWDPARKSDMKAVLINEATIIPFGLKTAKNAIGEKIIFGRDTLVIIGVLKNFYWESLKVTHHPTVIWPVEIYARRASILIRGNTRETVEQVRSLFKKHFPENTFKYYFANDFYDRMYNDDLRFGATVMLFSGFAIGVACIGLLGLATFAVHQRAREIGIRKVLGASVTSIVGLFSGKFGKLLFIAIVLAIPLSWKTIDIWLTNYPVRMNISALLFVLPAGFMIAIAAGAVVVQVWRGAKINPAKVLKQ